MVKNLSVVAFGEDRLGDKNVYLPKEQNVVVLHHDKWQDPSGVLPDRG
jgi:hypothetical protein